MPKGTPSGLTACTIEGCGESGPYVRGWCPPHYYRWSKYGDPRHVGPGKGGNPRPPRPIIPFGNLGLVTLTRGFTAMIDLTDRGLVAHRSWNAMPARHHTVYATSAARGNTTEGMHRVIMGLAFGDPRQVDHINHCGLDNRRANLRIVTKGQNQANARPRRGSSSRYKGVAWSTQYQQWIAYIQVDHDFRRLGLYDDEVSAARAYDAAALSSWGDHAYVNLPPG